MDVHYNEKYCQWVQDKISKKIYGMALKNEVRSLTAGTIMVYDREYFQVYFQLLENIDTTSLKALSYIAFEPGSLICYGCSLSSKKAPIIKFKDCRLPTVKEISKYNEKCVI